MDIVILNRGRITRTAPEMEPHLQTSAPHQREEVWPLTCDLTSNIHGWFSVLNLEPFEPQAETCYRRFFSAKIISRFSSFASDSSVSPLDLTANVEKTNGEGESGTETFVSESKDGAETFVSESKDGTEAFVSESKDGTEAFVSESKDCVEASPNKSSIVMKVTSFEREYQR
ncbi:hypothetical protein AVEN_139840-1 [Araneus ventricosus]|uniref:Uncharacterized protein n=1 Tax=Araneus ventricosus TaxID=182803 RepID=A0A4Y2FYR7_ARAVE|nr:hypothetical protein AVEN_139840-1 [Araneus ventricosus]